MTIKTQFVISAQDDTAKAVDKATKGFSSLEKQGEKSTDVMAAAFSRLAAPIAGVISLTEGFSKLINVTREFDALNAGLITATGSAAGATQAFAAIQEFASTTPYDLKQVTEGFTKLVNYGLTPSERALTAYGDTASAMGKDLNQMIEAVADAASGEFERLKEFGIKSKKEGDQVSFTFRGVTTTVKNSAAEIESYLLQLSENNFAGAMAQRMDSLDGALSNLSDTWDQLFLNVSQAGLGKVIADGVNLAITALNHLNKEISSGKLESRLNTWSLGWRTLDVDASTALRSMGFETSSTVDLISAWLEKGVDAWKLVFGTAFDLFIDFPNKVNIAVTTAFAYITELANSAILTYEALKKALNPFDDTSADAAFKEAEQRQKDLEKRTSQTIADKIAKLQAEKDLQLMMNSMLDDEIAKREKINATMTEDRLAKFSAAKPGGASGGGTAAGDLTSMSLLQNDQSIDRQSWNPVDDPEVIKAQERISYLQTLKDAQLATEMQSEELAFLNRMEMLRVRYEDNEIPALETYNKLKEEVQRKHEEKLTALTSKGAAARAAFEKKSLQDQSKQVFGELAGITAGVAQHNKGMFELNKAAGIANAIINTYQGVSMSLAAYPMPLAAVMAAAHLAAGLAQVSAIKSQSFGSGSPGATSVGTVPVTTAPSNIADSIPTADQQSPKAEQKVVYISLEENSIYSTQTVRKLIEAINEEAGNNVRIVA